MPAHYSGFDKYEVNLRYARQHDMKKQQYLGLQLIVLQKINDSGRGKTIPMWERYRRDAYEYEDKK